MVRGRNRKNKLIGRKGSGRKKMKRVVRNAGARGGTRLSSTPTTLPSFSDTLRNYPNRNLF